MGEVDGVPAQRHKLNRTQAMPVGDRHHGGVAMAVAVGPGGSDEAVYFGVGQVFTRPHLGIVYPFGRPAVRLDCPNNSGWRDQRQVRFCHWFSGLFPQSVPEIGPLGTAKKATKANKYQAKCPPPVSFVAIGLFVATIGYSIGLNADIFHDVAGAEVSRATSRCRRHLSQIGATGTWAPYGCRRALGRSGRCPSEASHVRRHDDARANSATSWGSRSLGTLPEG